MKTKKHGKLFIFFLAAILSISLIHPHSSTVNQAAAASNASETALFLAGNPLPKTSELYSYTKSKSYKSYKKQLNNGWKKFQKPNIIKIKKWWTLHSPKKAENDILYPFSGPDIMNALTFFPDADTYTMFGLENPGIIPSPHSMEPHQINAGLNGVRDSLNTILRVNFFRTKGMAKKLGDKSFNGITGLMMIFLVKNDYTVINARKIVIDGKSNISPWRQSDNSITWQNPPKSKRIPGIEITFRKGKGKVQRVRYFMLNVIDYALKTQSPNFIPYLKKDAPYTTVLKSASYLMHNGDIKFTKIRAAVLSMSNYIIQDDSGIPLKYLPSSKWKLGFHGVYDNPIPLFANRTQKDFKMEMKEKSTGTLPLSYGYDYKKDQSNLMTAERKR